MSDSPEIPEKLTRAYDPQETEPRIYRTWEQSGYFTPERLIEDNVIAANAPPYTIMMPPPNRTGILHMGHALMLTIEDILVRYKRMRGFRTLWLPGTDHAAIATQSKVEKELQKKEKKNRHDLGREEFLRRVVEFADDSHKTITDQVKRFGASCDWTREAYTLDEVRNRAVNEVFKRMYDDGLIYRGHRIVNWDPKGQTTVSDEEVDHREEKATLYTFRYAPDFPILISTTRPETKLGDTGVAVHPDDKRYREYIGKTFEVEFCGESLSLHVVGDEEVDPEFGTGAVGITPAHSHTDWDIADRHDLPSKTIINEYGKMIVGPEGVVDKKTAIAREAVVQWIRENGLMEHEEEITHNIAIADRTGGVIEPLPKLQWFVAVNKEFTLPHSHIEGIPSGSTTTLKNIMRTVVENGQIDMIPDHFNKTYFHWIDNLRDWCISRQIWFGHRIPVWYKEEEIYCGTQPPEGDGWEQDPDTLDTWFSSGIWTFSTLGWPEETADFKLYHPTDVLETGHDILFFWVARMVLMTGYALGDIPFHTIYLHGMVRDGKGQKMSKSLGNVLDPVEIAEKFGADAGRMALVVGNTPGTDSRIWEDKVKAHKHFANKLWNIGRFITEQTTSNESGVLTENDKELKKEFDDLVTEITQEMETYRFYLVAEKLYQYAWHRLADELLEESKTIFREGDEDACASRRTLLRDIYGELLTILHPFMPFVTEELWSLMDYGDTLLMIKSWPDKK